MIAFSYIEENYDGFFFKKNISLKSSLQKQFFQDNLDFNIYSLQDLIDYLNIQQTTDYIFISYGKRVEILAKYLSMHSNINFHVVTPRGKVKLGENQLIKNFWFALKINFESIENSTISLDSEYINRKLRGIYQFMTGIYPGALPKHIIKHVFVEDVNLLTKLNPKIFLDFGINSVVYLGNDLEEFTFKTLLPVLILSFSQVKNSDNFRKMDSLTEQEVKHKFQTFNKHSIIQGLPGNGIIDFSTHFNFDANNRLFVYSDGIFADFKKKKKLSTNIGANFLQLKNSSSRQNKISINKDQIIIFHVCYVIKGEIDQENDLFFIELFEEDTLLKESYLGINNFKDYYIYSIQKNKIIKISREFFEILNECSRKQLNQYQKKIISKKLEKMI